MPLDIANLNFDDVLGSVNDIQSALDKYVVRPSNAFGLGGFVFDIEDDTEINLQSEITDHYTEANAAAQDHIATRPLTVRLTNFVGELVYRPEGEGDSFIQNAVRKLTVVSDYLPKLTAGAAQAKSIFEGQSSIGDLTSQQSLSKLSNLYGAVKDLIPPTDRQQEAFLFFKALWEQKIVTSVDTPFGFFADMAIESVTATQYGTSKYISEFSISLKQLRYFETKTTKYDAENSQGDTSAQAAPEEDGGKTRGTLPAENKSGLASLIDAGVPVARKLGGAVINYLPYFGLPQ